MHINKLIFKNMKTVFRTTLVIWFSLFIMWTLDANISFNRNKISGLNADQFSDVVWGMESMFLRRNGYAIGTLYGYVEDGFYDNEAEVRADPYYANATPSKVKSMLCSGLGDTADESICCVDSSYC